MTMAKKKTITPAPATGPEDSAEPAPKPRAAKRQRRPKSSSHPGPATGDGVSARSSVTEEGAPAAPHPSDGSFAMPDSVSITVTNEVGLPEAITISVEDLKNAIQRAPDLLISTVTDLLRSGVSGQGGAT